MKLVSPNLHGIIDYLVVLFLLASPGSFGFTGLLAYFTYGLGGVHLVLTMITKFDSGLFKILPFSIHGIIECVVGAALIVLAFTLFKDNNAGKLFYAIFGIAVLLVWYITDYKDVKKA